MSTPAPSDPAAAAAAQAAMASAFQSFTVEAWSLLGVALLVTIARTIDRIRTLGIKGLQVDDYLVWVGVIFYAIETSLAYCVGQVAHGLANNGMTDEQRAALSPHSPEWKTRVIGSKIQLCGWASYSVLLWALKASLLVFYLRLTAGLARSYRIRIYIGFAFLIATWITIVLSLFLTCRPFHKYWQIYPDPGNSCQPAISNQIIWTYFSCNVSTDLYLISIPVPMLWNSTLKPIKKIALIVIFSGGLLVVACATLRCVMIVIDPVNGAMAAGSWAVRETFVAVVTTNLPMIYPLLKIWFTFLFGPLVSTIRSTDKMSKGTPRDIITFGGGGNSGRGRGPASANPITNITFNESEERMIDEYKMQDMKTWSDSSSRKTPTGHNIRKNVEVTIVRGQQDGYQGDEESRANFSFPRRTAGGTCYAGNRI